MKFKGKLFAIFMLFSSLNAKDLVWDFGGIMFDPSYVNMGLKVGPSYFLKYMIMDFRSPDVQNKLFEFLETVMADDKRFGPVGTGDGRILPTIMRHWQAGTILPSEIVKIATEHVQKMDKIGYFGSKYEKDLIQRIIETMFSPEALAECVYPVEQGIDLLKKCISAKNPDGTKRNRNFGCSNWDGVSYKLVKEKYPEVVALFDGIIVSGDIGKVKPDRDFYEHIITEFNLNPVETLLIDDQEVNAKGARKCNMGTLILKSWDYKVLEQQLKLCGAL